MAASGISFALTADSNTLSTHEGTLADAQAAQAQAYVQLQADLSTQTALTDEYDALLQAYNTATQAAADEQTIAVQDQVVSAQAIAAVVATATPQPMTVSGQLKVTDQANGATGSGIAISTPITSSATTGLPGATIQSSSPLTVGASITFPGPIDLEAKPESSSETGDDLTVGSGVTIQSTGSSVSLVAGDNVVIPSGATIQASSTIVIIGDTNYEPSGANVTVAGTLNAPGAFIAVPLNATGPHTFNITPSATTPMLVEGAAAAGTDTLNFYAGGRAVTLSGNGDTITAAGMQPVAFEYIAHVNIIDAANGGASYTLAGFSGQANTLSLVGTAQGAGTVTIDGFPPLSFSGVASFNYQGGSGDTISVTPYAAAGLPWHVAVTVAGTSGSPASLTYNSVASLADTLTPTGAGAGTIGSPGLASVQFSSVGILTTNAGQSPGDQLTLNLRTAAPDTAVLQSADPNTADIQLNGLFGLDIAAYAGLTINGSVGTYVLATPTAGLPMPLTLNTPDVQCVVNTAMTTTVNATASGDTISVTAGGLVVVTGLSGNVSLFDVTDPQLVLNVPGNSDTINVAGNHPFKNGLDVYGNASFSDILNDTAGSGDAVTVTPSSSTISETGAGATYGPVVYAGISRVNLTASDATSTLAVDGSAGQEDFAFTPTAAAAGSFTATGPGAASATPQFTYTGVGNGVTVNGGSSGSDQLDLTCTPGNETVDAEQTAAGTLAFTEATSVNSSFTVPYNLTNIGSVSIAGTAGNDLFEVGVAPQVTPAASLDVNVVGSSIHNDQLLVKDEGSGNVERASQGVTPGSGSVTVGNFNPVTFHGIANVKVQPNVTVTAAGGTYNGKAFSATALVNGQFSLDKITPKLTYYKGTSASGTGSSTAPTNAGTYTVVASYAGDATYASASATTTFTINPAPLTASIVGNPTKVYDGATTATPKPANFKLAGLIGTQSFTVTLATGTYNGKDVSTLVAGQGVTPATGVTASLSASNFTAAPGTLASNYVLPLTATGQGTITPKTLTASIIGDPTKPYDGTTDAVLTSANYSITGLVGSEGFTITQTVGTYNTKAVGAKTVTANLTPANFTAGSGTVAGDYVLPKTAAGSGTITASTLTVPQVTVNPVLLTAGQALANSQLSGSATVTVNNASVSVPGTLTYTSAAGTVLPYSSTPYRENVTFTPTGSGAAKYATVQATVSIYAVGPISITGFSPGTPVAGQALPSQNLSVTDALGNAFPSSQGSGVTATVSIQDVSTSAGDVLGTVVVSNGVLALKHMTIPHSFSHSTCQLVVTLDGFVWTSSDFTVQ